MTASKEKIQEWEQQFQKMSVRVPKELYKAFKIQVIKDNENINAIMNKFIQVYVESKKEEE